MGSAEWKGQKVRAEVCFVLKGCKLGLKKGRETQQESWGQKIHGCAAVVREESIKNWEKPKIPGQTGRSHTCRPSCSHTK